ncbi:hypothetical protein SAMN04487898_105136 [Pedobacter sp. ok626]|uniref:hypothetical protein n=1 Tax=Pedobacter sp. ok626 TaxID=1761882 RepID=UPI00088A3A37|nr:hypothetical protein [Pedobacter sp. ok626]SDJ95222.1 hypothetical protein SAMN04487898_105136 [Pedobacter sp. ok626]
MDIENKAQGEKLEDDADEELELEQGTEHYATPKVMLDMMKQIVEQQRQERLKNK